MAERSMPAVEEILKRPYARVLVPDETGGYVAEVLEFPDCFSEGDTPDEAIENLEDAMQGYVVAALEQGMYIPDALESAEFGGRILLRVPKEVHRECARRAQANDVSVNQWILEAIGERLGAEGYMERLLKQTQPPRVIGMMEEKTRTIMWTDMPEPDQMKTLIWTETPEPDEIDTQYKLIEPTKSKLATVFTKLDRKEVSRNA